MIEIIARAGAFLLMLLFYVVIFWGIPSIQHFDNRKFKFKGYILYVSVIHIVFGIVVWGSWGLSCLNF